MQKPREVSSRVWQKASQGVRAMLAERYPETNPVPTVERREAMSDADRIFRAAHPKNVGTFDVELFATSRFYRPFLSK